MKAKISPIQIQKTILAPSMQQSIEVLLLPLVELNMAIDQELQENPLLEVDEEKTAQERQQFEELVNRSIQRITEAPITPSYDYMSDDEPQEEIEDRPIAGKTCLEDYLLKQLHLELTDPLEIKIGELIIGNLDEDGYLQTTCEEIAQELNIDDLKRVQAVLNTVQHFEPIGIAARDLKECLLMQAEYRFNGNSDLVQKTIAEHLDELGRKKYPEIARKLKISLEQVKEIAKLIASLEPKPARKYRPVQSNIYIKPDITIYKDTEDKYHAVINKENIPVLRVNSLYQRMLKEPNRKPEELEFIREKIKKALFFIKSIEQRHETIRRISEYILEHQKDFFDQGHLALKPMILKDVAQSIERNESTVCRAINNKYVDCPQGILPMKFFFSQGVQQADNKESISSRSIKEEIRELIEDEDKSKPLSDQEILQHFESKGMKVARRTISKYRQTMNILPSHLRKE